VSPFEGNVTNFNEYFLTDYRKTFRYENRFVNLKKVPVHFVLKQNEPKIQGCEKIGAVT